MHGTIAAVKTYNATRKYLRNSHSVIADFRRYDCLTLQVGHRACRIADSALETHMVF